MNETTLRETALAFGYQLRPLRSTTIDTLGDLRQAGEMEARDLARIRRINHTTASMRLARLLSLGFASVDQIGPRGEARYRLTELGVEAAYRLSGEEENLLDEMSARGSHA